MGSIDSSDSPASGGSDRGTAAVARGSCARDCIAIRGSGVGDNDNAGGRGGVDDDDNAGGRGGVDDDDNADRRGGVDDEDNAGNNGETGVVDVRCRVEGGAIISGSKGGCGRRVRCGAKDGCAGGVNIRSSDGAGVERGAAGSGVERGRDGGCELRSGGGVIARDGAGGSSARVDAGMCERDGGAGATSAAIGSGGFAMRSVTFIFSVAWRSGPAAARELNAGSALALTGGIVSVAPRLAISRCCETGAELGGELAEGSRFAAKNAAISAWLAT